MSLLTASVGQGGANNKQDVMVVEFLLNRSILQIYPPFATTENGRVSFEASITVIPVDGKIDPGVVDAIRNYQRNVLGFKWPDGRVDPGKNTIRALTRSFIAQGGVVALLPQNAARLMNPKASYDRQHGAPYQTGIYRAGRIYAGLDGSRLVLNISPRETVFLLLDNAGPGKEMADLNPMRGKIGTVYRQSTAAFLDERDSMFFHDLAKRLQGVKTLIELEMAIMLAIFSGTSTAGLVLVMGASGLQFVVENGEKFPKWASAVSTVLAVRRTLKRYTPKLYEKMCEGLFIGVKRGTLVAIGFAGDDVLANLPDAMVKDPTTTGKLIGALIANLGKAGLAKRLTLFGAVFAILKTLATKAAMAVPGAIGLTAQEKVRHAQDILARLRAAGVPMSEEEARAIIDEVERHAREIRPALDDLARAFQSL
jgi:hypothetical protein